MTLLLERVLWDLAVEAATYKQLKHTSNIRTGSDQKI